MGLAGEPLGVRALGAQERQGQVQTLRLAVPALVFGAFAAAEQVGLGLVQAGKQARVDVQDWASQAGLTEMILSLDASRPRRWV